MIAAAPAPYTTWRSPTGGSADSANFTALSQITPANVDELEVAWSYATGDDTSWTFGPIVIGRTVYGFADNDKLVAVDAATGREIWRRSAPPQTTGMRGFNYWESEDGSQKRLFLTGGLYLYAVDATTGVPAPDFGVDGRVDLREGFDRAPETIRTIASRGSGRIFEDLLILGSSPGEGYEAPPGDIRAFNVRTGKLVWTFHTIPRPGEFGYESNPPDAWKYIGANNNWGDMSLDAQRGIVYIPTGSPTYDFWGGDRKGDNLFGNSILALDARTGKRVWHFQTIHHDLGDYDLVSAPQLITIRQGGRTIDAVAQAGKAGFLYVFDRVTGAPIWPIVERPVPRSTAPGEHDSPTQPFPTKPPAFARQSFTAADINPHLTPKERAEVLRLLDGARNEGIFTPPELNRFSVQMPGHSGGSALGGTSADPGKGLVYIVSFDGPAFLKLVPSQAEAAKSTYFGPLVSEIGGCDGVCRDRVLDPASRGRTPAQGQASPNAAEIALGKTRYGEVCAACHGDNRQGGLAPSLIGVTQRLQDQVLKAVIRDGKGAMPAFGASLTGADLNAITAYLRTSATPAGPPPAATSPNPVRATRYYSGYGFAPAAIKPPWSTLTAYDLNKGVIKWQIPYGSAEGVEPEGNDFGLLQFHSPKAPVIVTTTGLLFSATTDKKLRAYDQETGKVVWTANLPGRALGNPAVYEVGGRQFLLVITRGAYVAYALPEPRR